MKTLVIPLNNRGQIEDCLEATGYDLLIDLQNAVREASPPLARGIETVHRNTCQTLRIAAKGLAGVHVHELALLGGAISLRFCKPDVLRKYGHKAIAEAVTEGEPAKVVL